jgi:asparagine synthase (glutamine-hydrolysing)
MCGIVGRIGRSEQSFADRIASLRHRGPDGEGVEAFEVAGQRVEIGQTRLAILDLSSAGRQPMSSRDERWCVTFNGEIYNHLELRRELQGPWRGHSDTETLVEAIAAWGIEEATKRFNGMFAFAAVDRRDGLLWLARDPFGIKPLYFARSNVFSFASEIRGLEPGKRTVDAESLSRCPRS